MLKTVVLGCVVAVVAVVAVTVGPASASAAPGHLATVAKPHQASPDCNYTNAEPTLREGATGAAVKQAQCELNFAYAYYSNGDYGNGPWGGLTVDGAFGPHMDTVTRRFQACVQTGVDGIIGPQTWSALDYIINASGHCLR